MGKDFIIKDYGRKTTFASFLPGIAGTHGIPIWCYYVNRGQCVASFGVLDKNHSIMEFYPAHTAYQNVKRTGFRTFVRCGSSFYEPFSAENETQEMDVFMNKLKLRETEKELKLSAGITYFVLPGEKVGALVRRVRITNLSEETRKLELLDGMPAVVPCGVSLDTLKNMTETGKAWMQAEDAGTGVPYFRVRASMEDSASVGKVEGGNFALALTEESFENGKSDGYSSDGYSVDDYGLKESGKGKSGCCSLEGAGKGKTGISPGGAARLLPVTVDPEKIFAYDNSLERPVTFMNSGLSGVENGQQVTENRFPCCFFRLSKTLKAGESACLYELFGQAGSKEVLQDFLGGIGSASAAAENSAAPGNSMTAEGEASDAEKNMPEVYFAGKEAEADALAEGLTAPIATHTASEDFDAYSAYTYLDNGLRGGFPVRLGNNHVFYLYSRKHGDLERDYNAFNVLPEFYSQGNGNFRDVAQNRRSDVFFNPFVGDANIKKFFSLVQPDGYNPLVIEKSLYLLEKAAAEEAFSKLGDEERQEMVSFSTKPFTPGRLYGKLETLYGQVSGRASSVLKEQGADAASSDPTGRKDAGAMKMQTVQEMFSAAMDAADELPGGDFSEGYWSDHWTYSLDLIEDYLEVFPEKEEQLLYEKEFTYFLPKAAVRPRRKRYAETAKGLRQYHFLDEINREEGCGKWVKDTSGKGGLLKVTLMEKLLLLCAAKYSALDAYGMGVEMEGGKPGWYDALNGLPGIFGSSMAETYELERLTDYTIGALLKYPNEVVLSEEVLSFIKNLDGITRTEKKGGTAASGGEMDFWNKVNDAKEDYRSRIYEGFSGRTAAAQSTDLAAILEKWSENIRKGIAGAKALGDGIVPTYFSFEVTDYKKEDGGILPLHFKAVPMPHFLEGSVRILKLKLPKEEKQAICRSVREGDLYDRKLGMYKINASLQDMSYEAGRCRAFAAGWLENESIWLHMEYKYLLELLRSGLYEEFFEDFKKAAVPFLDPEVYGRSILENSSFIASSANKDASVRGKGFVARLSGSTAEFLSMWKLMMFGPELFRFEGGSLVFSPKPALPDYLVPEDGIVKAELLGGTDTVYHFEKGTSCIPGRYEIAGMKLEDLQGKCTSCAGSKLEGSLAEAVRNGKIRRIEIEVRTKK